MQVARWLTCPKGLIVVMQTALGCTVLGSTHSDRCCGGDDVAAYVEVVRAGPVVCGGRREFLKSTLRNS